MDPGQPHHRLRAGRDHGRGPRSDLLRQPLPDRQLPAVHRPRDPDRIADHGDAGAAPGPLRGCRGRRGAAPARERLSRRRGARFRRGHPLEHRAGVPGGRADHDGRHRPCRARAAAPGRLAADRDGDAAGDLLRRRRDRHGGAARAPALRARRRRPGVRKLHGHGGHGDLGHAVRHRHGARRGQHPATVAARPWHDRRRRGAGRRAMVGRLPRRGAASAGRRVARPRRPPRAAPRRAVERLRLVERGQLPGAPGGRGRHSGRRGGDPDRHQFLRPAGRHRRQARGLDTVAAAGAQLQPTIPAVLPGDLSQQPRAGDVRRPAIGAAVRRGPGNHGQSRIVRRHGERGGRRAGDGLHREPRVRVSSARRPSSCRPRHPTPAAMRARRWRRWRCAPPSPSAASRLRSRS